MDLVIWLCTHKLERAPQWVQRWRRRYLDHIAEHEVLGRMQDAQERHVGVADAWAEPGTPVAEILVWFDEYLAATPRVPGIDYFRFIVAATPTDDPSVLIAPDALQYEWNGSRAQWWAAGRDQVAAVCATPHTGLYIVANGLGNAWR
jgi:hypothetical protein